MDYFENQKKARKKTKILVLYFLIAVFLIITCIDLFILGFTFFFFSKSSSVMSMVSGINIPPHSTFYIGHDFIMSCFWNIASFVSPIIIFFIAIVMVLRFLSLKSGGISLAKLIGATFVSPNTLDMKEKEYVNISQEMAIASGTPLPTLFILENEMAINAFVAGTQPSNTVLVITKGALLKLNRDELQGVIGHEYSHIFNGDMLISFNLIGILSGILMIGQLGGILIRSAGKGVGTVSGERGNLEFKEGNLDPISFWFLLLSGIGLFSIGYIGLFLSRLIKAAISRERELLADASAVQFTRNPIGLLSALKKIEENNYETYLNSNYSEEINHLCFLPGLPMFFKLLRTHPSLETRIKLLDPEGILLPTLLKKINK